MTHSPPFSHMGRFLALVVNAKLEEFSSSLLMQSASCLMFELEIHKTLSFIDIKLRKLGHNTVGSHQNWYYVNLKYIYCISLTLYSLECAFNIMTWFVRSYCSTVRAITICSSLNDSFFIKINDTKFRKETHSLLIRLSICLSKHRLLLASFICMDT